MLTIFRIHTNKYGEKAFTVLLMIVVHSKHWKSLQWYAYMYVLAPHLFVLLNFLKK